jgi:hypothetical protein
MFCKEGESILVSLQSDKRADGAENPLSVTEDDWKGPLSPFFRIDILHDLILSFPGALIVSRFVQ